MNETFLDTLKNLLMEGDDLIVATMVETRGSAPQEKGAKVIVGKNGLLYGTIGGGKIETQVIKHSVSLINDKETFNDFKEWNLQTDIGMTCGGVASIYFEKYRAQARWEIAVFGAGHVSQELIRSLLRLDCQITCIDPRADWLDKLPEDRKLKKIQTENMASQIELLSPHTYIACVTMGHAFDLPILKAAIQRNCFPYIGAIGSIAKAKVMKRDLEAQGISLSQLEKLVCPIGENFGNNTPAEITFSIVAQLIKERDKNDS